MQYILCNLPKVFQKVRTWRQILISQQNSIFGGLKFLCEFKLFGEGPSHLRTTSATLCWQLNCPLVKLQYMLLISHSFPSWNIAYHSKSLTLRHYHPRSFAHKNNKCGFCRFQSPRPYISLLPYLSRNSSRGYWDLPLFFRKICFHFQMFPFSNSHLVLSLQGVPKKCDIAIWLC